MENPEVIQLAKMQMVHEYDVDGRSREWCTFDILWPDAVDRQPVTHGAEITNKVANPKYGDAVFHYDWFLSKKARKWVYDMGLKYQLYWRETTALISYRGSRFYVLEACFSDAKAAMLFKLAWGGTACLIV